MLPPEPDVIAYDEDMNVIFQWNGCPGVTELKELPRQGLARVAIEQARLIRRRDGLVLKGPQGDPLEQFVRRLDDDHDDEPVDYVPTEPTRLERVELIPPPEELDEHVELSNEQLAKVALWKALMAMDEESLALEDKDIVRALSFGRISIERDRELVVFRAHLGSLDVISIADEAPEQEPDTSVLQVACPRCKAESGKLCRTRNYQPLPVVQSHKARWDAQRKPSA